MFAIEASTRLETHGDGYSIDDGNIFVHADLPEAFHADSHLPHLSHCRSDGGSIILPSFPQDPDGPMSFLISTVLAILDPAEVEPLKSGPQRVAGLGRFGRRSTMSASPRPCLRASACHPERCLSLRTSWSISLFFFFTFWVKSWARVVDHLNGWFLVLLTLAPFCPTPGEEEVEVAPLRTLNHTPPILLRL